MNCDINVELAKLLDLDDWDCGSNYLDGVNVGGWVRRRGPRSYRIPDHLNPDKMHDGHIILWRKVGWRLYWDRLHIAHCVEYHTRKYQQQKNKSTKTIS